MINSLQHDPPEPEGDAEIVRLMAAGQGAGLHLLLQRYGGRIQTGLRRAFGGTLSDSEIDDAMNDAAFNAWRSINQYDPAKGTLRGWFYVIARNAGAAVLRSRKRSGLEPRSDDLERMPAESPEEEPQVPTAFLRAVRECVAALPRMQRHIIEADLRSGDVADASQLAKELGTSKNSIYVSRNSGRKALRRALEERGFGPSSEDES